MEDKVEFIIEVTMFGAILIMILTFMFAGFVGLVSNIKLKVRGNNSEMQECNSCGHQISRFSRTCLYCGRDYGSMNSVYNSIIGCILLIIVMIPFALITGLALLETFDITLE